MAVLLAATGCSVALPADSPAEVATHDGIPVLAAIPALPDSAGVTTWQTVLEPPPGMGIDDSAYESAGELLTEVARPLSANDGGQVRVAFLGVPENDRARAVVQSWGALDDSLLGVEYDLDLIRGPDGWYVAGARVRTHCRRGVTEDGSLCV